MKTNETDVHYLLNYLLNLLAFPEAVRIPIPPCWRILDIQGA